MARHKLHRIVRAATPAESRRHRQIRRKTDQEFAQRRKPIIPTQAVLAKLRSKRELMGYVPAASASRRISSSSPRVPCSSHQRST